MNTKNIPIAKKLISRLESAEKAEKDLEQLQGQWDWMKIQVSGKTGKATVDIQSSYTFGIYEALQKEVTAQKETAKINIEKL